MRHQSASDATIKTHGMSTTEERDVDRYGIEIFWSDEDEAWIAIAPDLPGSSCVADSRAKAAADIAEVIAGHVEAHRAAGNPIPTPSAHPSLSR